MSLRGRVQMWDEGQSADTLELCESVSTMFFGEGYAFAGLRDGRVLVRTTTAPIFSRRAAPTVALLNRLPLSATRIDAHNLQVYASAEGRLRGAGKNGPVKEILSFAAHNGEVTCIQARSRLVLSSHLLPFSSFVRAIDATVRRPAAPGWPHSALHRSPLPLLPAFTFLSSSRASPTATVTRSSLGRSTARSSRGTSRAASSCTRSRGTWQRCRACRRAGRRRCQSACRPPQALSMLPQCGVPKPAERIDLALSGLRRTVCRRIARRS